MSLEQRARLPHGPDLMCPANKLVGSIAVAQWKTVLQCVKDAYEAPCAIEGVGLVKQFACPDAESTQMVRTLSRAEVSPEHAAIGGKSRDVSNIRSLLRRLSAWWLGQNSVCGFCKVRANLASTCPVPRRMRHKVVPCRNGCALQLWKKRIVCG